MCLVTTWICPCCDSEISPDVLEKCRAALNGTADLWVTGNHETNHVRRLLDFHQRKTYECPTNDCPLNIATRPRQDTEMREATEKMVQHQKAEQFTPQQQAQQFGQWGTQQQNAQKVIQQHVLKSQPQPGSSHQQPQEHQVDPSLTAWLHPTQTAPATNLNAQVSHHSPDVQVGFIGLVTAVPAQPLATPNTTVNAHSSMPSLPIQSKNVRFASPVSSAQTPNARVRENFYPGEVDTIKAMVSQGYTWAAIQQRLGRHTARSIETKYGRLVKNWGSRGR